MATTVARLEAILGADTRGFDSAMNRSESRMGKVGKAAGLAGLAIAGGLAVGLKKSVDAALEAEQAENRLTSAMDQAGLSAKQRAAANEAISATSRMAALDDEALSDVYARLVRTTGDATKAQEGMALAADIARARNISLEASSKMVERAMSGNEAAFSRIGLKLESTATAQDVLAAAQKRFAGAAEDYGKTAAGAQERFGVAVENLQEKIGQKLLPVLAKLMEMALKVIESIERNWPRIMEVIGPTMERVREVIQKVTADVQRIWEQHGATIMAVVKFAFGFIKTTIENTMQVIQGVIDLAMGILTGDWERAWDGIKGIVDGVFSQIENLITTAATVLGKAAKAVGTAIFNGIKDGVTGIAATVWNIINNIGATIADARATIIGWGTSVATAIVSGVVDGLVGIGMKAWGIINNIGSVIDDFRKQIFGWGGDVARSLLNGLLDGLEGLGSKIWEKIKGAFDWVKSKIPSLPKFDIPGIGDASDPNFNPFIPPAGSGPVMGGINLMGARPEMMPFAVAAQGLGLRVTSGFRPGAITANGTPSDHGIGKALDLSNGYNTPQMAAFFKSLIGNPAVKQAFYDPLGSIFGGKWSSYVEGGHSDHVHVATYDRGGWLQPGLTLAYNGTGRPERVGNQAGVVVNVTVNGWVGNDRSLARQIRDALGNLDRATTGGRTLNATPTLT